MSRKSDLELSWRAATLAKVAEAAYALGRAAQAKTDAQRMSDKDYRRVTLTFATRLRARVRKIVEGK